MIKNNWIAANKPPKESGRYWCYVKEVNDLGTFHYQWNVFYDKEENKWSTDKGDKVTHWIPLQKPPKH